MRAISFGQGEAVTMLLKAGANIHVANNGG